MSSSVTSNGSRVISKDYTLVDQPLSSNQGEGNHMQVHVPIRINVTLEIMPITTQNGLSKPTIHPPQEQVHESLDGFEVEDDVLERTINYSGREGYRPDFLDTDEQFHVPLPKLSAVLEKDAAIVSTPTNGSISHELKYMHFSVVMNRRRRMPFFTAVNIDGRQLRRIPRSDKWFKDPRINQQAQFGNELYANNDLDRGHMVRRLDPVWGTVEEATIANDDTFHYTNSCPQHKDLNQRTWNDLEDYILDNADAHDFKVSVFTGPVFRADDIPYRSARIPREFWKVAVLINNQTKKLSATAYLLSQADMINNLEFVYGAYRTYQISIAQVEALTDLDFGDLREFDPIGSGINESVDIRIVERPQNIIF
ncbi:DNA/RNA non-specific endonuclease [Telluribacter sp. SYSU D00476]|uniref:DNA/RNA non-specific endonuclease n=1 Tax=Telluribacter sp. SYSU D00476 TaxID=2811430 RepID=UPI001FF613FA|nr:DNA/RNA non-specific endonuclease [Telluribacter sp. SYSU D00476]